MIDYLKDKLECVIARINFLQDYCKPTDANMREMDILLDIQSEIEFFINRGINE